MAATFSVLDVCVVLRWEHDGWEYASGQTMQASSYA